MFFTKFIEWITRWDRYRTVFIFLVADSIQAEAQLLYFVYFKVWEAARAFLINELGTIKSSSKFGFQQFPSFEIMLYYFTVVGALVARLFINWLIFDGIGSGDKSEVKAGLMGLICTSVYIVIGGIMFWVEQYVYFHLAWYHLALAVVAFIFYGVLSSEMVYILWIDDRIGSSKHVSVSLILMIVLFMVFVQCQLLVVFFAYVWLVAQDPVLRTMTDRFPV